MDLEREIYKYLKENNYKISTAESVTGGLIVSTLVNVSGMSEFLKESYVVYSNESKIKILGVDKETIEKNTVVSKEVILEMLNGLYKISKSDVCIVTSGYAESGKVSYFGIKIKNNFYIKKNNYFGNRNEIRNKILENIFKFILNVSHETKLI